MNPQFSTQEVDDISSQIDNETAMKIAKSVLSTLAQSPNSKAEFELTRNSNQSVSASAIPCVVSINTPFGCICVAPPGGDC